MGRAVGVWLLQEVTVEAALTWSTQRHMAHTDDGHTMGEPPNNIATMHKHWTSGHKTGKQKNQGSNYRDTHGEFCTPI